MGNPVALATCVFGRGRALLRFDPIDPLVIGPLVVIPLVVIELLFPVIVLLGTVIDTFSPVFDDPPPIIDFRDKDLWSKCETDSDGV